MSTIEAAFQIRVMTPADLEQALDWAAAEGWNPGLQDGIAFRAADPQGFFVGEINGNPIGSVSAVRYGDRFGFMGLYVVIPEWRGQGYGLRLWQAGLEHLHDRAWGLDGVIAQIHNYEKFGFRILYRHIRHEGIGKEMGSDQGTVPLTEIPREQIEAYDREHFAFDRPAFLAEWIRLNWGCGVMDTGRLKGFGVIRVCRQGFKIGPLFADSAEVADRLFQTLSARAVGHLLYLDIPDVNSEAQDLVHRYDMTPVFECARMVTGTSPSVDLQQIFGVTSLELG